MLEITRSLARQFRALLRKTLMADGRRGTPVMLFRADRTGLYVQAQDSGAVLQYHQTGRFSPCTLLLPAAALNDFEGAKDAPVRLEGDADRITASWEDGGKVRERTYERPDLKAVPSLKEVSENLKPQPDGFLRALKDACETASKDSVRFATNHLLLKGRKGQVVATDGKQLLVQSGFSFPWEGELLVPALPAFGSRELSGLGPVSVGQTDGFVTLVAGPWAIHLAVNKDGRYPGVEGIIPSARKATSVLHIDPADAEFLLLTLPSLPGAEDDTSVTVACDGTVLLRARDSDGKAAEVSLARSRVEGKALSFATPRDPLARALRLGFRTVHLTAPDHPALCQDDRRQYVWALLGKDAVQKPDKEAVRPSSGDARPTKVEQAPDREEAEMVTPHCNGNGQPVPGQDRTPAEVPASRSAEAGVGAVIAEVEAIRELLRDTYTRTHQLLADVKRLRKRDKVVRSTLASLRELQQIEA